MSHPQSANNCDDHRNRAARCPVRPQAQGIRPAAAMRSHATRRECMEADAADANSGAEYRGRRACLSPHAHTTSARTAFFALDACGRSIQRSRRAGMHSRQATPSHAPAPKLRHRCRPARRRSHKRSIRRCGSLTRKLPGPHAAIRAARPRCTTTAIRSAIRQILHRPISGRASGRRETVADAMLCECPQDGRIQPDPARTQVGCRRAASASSRVQRCKSPKSVPRLLSFPSVRPPCVVPPKQVTRQGTTSQSLIVESPSN